MQPMHPPFLNAGQSLSLTKAANPQGYEHKGTQCKKS